MPAGTAATWPPLPGTLCVADAVLRCPSPQMVTLTHAPGGRGRAWISPPAPSGFPIVTDADDLCEAVTVALARRHLHDVAHGKTNTSGGGGHMRNRLLQTGRIVHQDHWTLSGTDDRDVWVARAKVYRTLRDQEVPQEVCEDLRLITSELMTNAMYHTVSQQLFVWAKITYAEAVVGVLDRGPRPTEPLKPQYPEIPAEFGRGLALVDSLATRWADRAIGRGTAVEAAITLPHDYQEQLAATDPVLYAGTAPMLHPVLPQGISPSLPPPGLYPA
ncbi:ATP-binding protein [Streptomyces sp. NPDC005900]|uniref:ATP-binding protein n=1 Tax=Streptomyces sp. NPDC005900 TaxID=3154569 RepID=UPI0033C1C9E6